MGKSDNTLVMAAPLPIRLGRFIALVYGSALPARATLHEVRVFQHATRGRRPANGYVFEVDSDDDGTFDREMARETDGKGGGWFGHALSPPQVAYRVRFRTLEYPRYQGPNCGAAVIGDKEIYADETFPDSPVEALTDVPYLEVDERRGRAILRPSDLVRFRLVLAPGEAKVLHVVSSLE